MAEIYTRKELGDFNSVVCFKALVTGVAETLGDKAAAIALIAAGRQRGKSLAESLSLKASTDNLGNLASTLNGVLGKNGTRLCNVEKVVAEGEALKVYTSETVCSANEPMGSKMECTFTLGAVWGAIEAAIGKRYKGKQVESVLRGGSHDVFELTPL